MPALARRDFFYIQGKKKNRKPGERYKGRIVRMKEGKCVLLSLNKVEKAPSSQPQKK